MSPRSSHPPRHGVAHACVCGRLLGVQRGVELHIRQREAAYVCLGQVTVTCPRCRSTRTIVTTEQAS